MYLIILLRIEVSCEETGNVKLDGFAKHRGGRTPLVVMEFAGGIATHSEKKFADDEAKLYDTCVQLLQEPWPILDRICTVLYTVITTIAFSITYSRLPVFIVENVICFESLTAVESGWI